MMTRGRWQAIAAGYRTAKSRLVCVLVCGFRERSDAPNDTGTRWMRQEALWVIVIAAIASNISILMQIAGLASVLPD